MSKSYLDGLSEQVASLQARLVAGMPRFGWKVGINVPEVQRKLGLTHPLIGWLDGERVFASGAAVPVPSAGRVHVEPELCLRLGAALRPDADHAQACAAVDGIAPALELVDYARPAASLNDVVRGSMFHCATVLGAWQPPRSSLDLAAQVSVRVDDLQSEAARADLVPAQLGELVLLVARLLAEAGQQLMPGDHILSGSFTAKALPLRTGQHAEARLGDVGVVRCSVSAQT